MKASEARKQWKDVLDRAAKGEVIQIERGGVVFWLKAMVNVLPPGGKWLETDEVSSEVRPFGMKVKVDPDMPDNEFRLETSKESKTFKIKSVADVTKAVKNLQASDGKDYTPCKHGMVKGFCKKGCK